MCFERFLAVSQNKFKFVIKFIQMKSIRGGRDFFMNPRLMKSFEQVTNSKYNAFTILRILML